jgi:3-oxoacyl-[acyl-carrier protein] reductase
MSDGHRLDDKIAIITGAARGIGRAIAERFAAESAKVAIIDCSEEDLRAATANIVANGGRAKPFLCDLREETAVENTVEAVVREWGSIHILVNNAGIFPERVPFPDVSFDQWRAVIDVNLFGVFRCTRAVSRRMIDLRIPGRIINISSINAVRYRRGTYGQTQYNVSKGALDNLTKGLAMELAPHDIVVNAIAPGFVRTRLSEMDSLDAPEFRKEYLESGRIPLRRYGMPEDCARLALFLASDECTWITGETIHQDGGMHFTF